jgi:hypothetical protein
VALTIADLAGCDGIAGEGHLLMALALRAPGVLGSTTSGRRWRPVAAVVP